MICHVKECNRKTCGDLLLCRHHARMVALSEFKRKGTPAKEAQEELFQKELVKSRGEARRILQSQYYPGADELE